MTKSLPSTDSARAVVSTDPAREKTRELLLSYSKTRDPKVRDQLVELNSDLVHFIARRFANRGEPLEDLEQVGFVGLIAAIERFDPSLENEFSTFATPTIMGEIRRYFRDRSWSVRVPRRLQETYLKINRARDELSGKLGRDPSVQQIGEHLGLSPEEVLAALEVAPAQHAVSLEAPTASDDSGGVVQDRLGIDDNSLEQVELRSVLDGAMKHLSPREKEILLLRFVEQLPQTEVAEKLGISQMHVSRLQKAALETLRQQVGDEPQA